MYANMSYPIYASPVGFTCGTDARFPVIESPNGNPDADTEISPTSHEVSEAITDPDTETGWYDSTGNENGDDCAYIFGRTRGAARRVLQPGDQRRALHHPGRVQQQPVRKLRRYRRVPAERIGPALIAYGPRPTRVTDRPQPDGRNRGGPVAPIGTRRVQ